MFYTVIDDEVLIKFLDENNIKGDERALIIEKVRRENILHLSLNDRLLSNLKALETFYPHLYTRFKDYKFKNKVEFFIEESGTINFTYNGSLLYENIDAISREQALSFLNKSPLSRFAVNSIWDEYGQLTHRYLNEGIELFQKDFDKNLILKDFESIPMLFIFGICSAFYFDTLYDNIDIKRALVFEPNEDFFFIALHFYDFNNLFNYIKDNGFYLDFCIGEDKDGMMAFISDYLNKNGHFVADVASFFIHTNTEVIEDTIKEISKNYIALNLTNKGFLDDSLFALSHSFYHIKHRHNFVMCDKSLNANILKSKVFIVANGPSLENDIAFLRENQDKALIIACGSALDSLYNSGIEADFFMVTERIPAIIESIMHLNKSNYLDNVILVGTDIIHHSTLKPFKKHMLYIKAGEMLFNMIEHNNTKYKNKFAYMANMNPLVTNFALTFALLLGFEDIYLFGSDCGKRSDAPLHFKDNLYYKSIETMQDRPSMKDRADYQFKDIIESNFDNGEITTIPLYKSAILVFESSIRNMSKFYKFNVTNCSDGAKIAYTKAKHSRDLDFKNVDVLNKALVKDTILNTLCKNIDFNLDDFAKLIDKDSYKDFCVSLIHDLSFKAEDRLSYLDNLYTIYKKVENTTCFNQDLLKGSIYYFLSLIVNALYKDKDVNKSLYIANSIKDLLTYFLEDSIELVYLLPNYLMGEHRALINNMVGHDHGSSHAISTHTNAFELDKSILSKMQNIDVFKKRYR